ncbi:MAG: STAS domain-containing protein [Ignavibacteriaceae bacterium]|jgi:anti-sigma B factor antagonist|nr:STAS domain-containing protein [Ignavibacteriaceae bacterium]
MFKIETISNNEIKILGRFTAADVNAAEPVFNQFIATTIVDFSELDYISSAGLSVLLKTQKRLKESKAELKLVNMSKMVREIFHYVGFETIFSIE